MWLCCFGHEEQPLSLPANNNSSDKPDEGTSTRQSAPPAFKIHEAAQQAAPDTPGSAASAASAATVGTGAGVSDAGANMLQDAAQGAPKQLHAHAQPAAHIELQPASWGSGNFAQTVSGMFQGDSRPGVLTVADFNHEIHDLAFIGQGASGDVYRGRWQGATVAVKYIVCQSPDAQQAATNEAALGRLLAHPNVVQTYSCKTSVLDEEFYAQLKRMLAAPPVPAPSLADDFQTPAEEELAILQATPAESVMTPPPAAVTNNHVATSAAAAAGTAAPPVPMSMLHGHTSSLPHPQGPSKSVAEEPQQQQGHVKGNAPAGYVAAAADTDEQQFWSGEGFGNPMGQRQSVLALQEVLLRADAKLGFQLTQIVMEHCDKGSLLQAINRGLFLPTSRWGPRLALRALLRTAQEVAQGMWHIHQANVIHGDLKPGNVLLKGSRADRRGFVAKVSDFGLSRISEHTTRDSQHWGTVHYMAPETFDGVLARQSDVYSFGITLWQMVTGAKPWENLHPGQIIVGVQAGTLTLGWPQDAHPRLVKLGQSCLQHDRKKRPGFNVIMKELSQIENMVRLQGAMLPDGPAEASAATSLAGSQPPNSGGAHAASLAPSSHQEPVSHLTANIDTSSGRVVDVQRPEMSGHQQRTQTHAHVQAAPLSGAAAGIQVGNSGLMHQATASNPLPPRPSMDTSHNKGGARFVQLDQHVAYANATSQGHGKALPVGASAAAGVSALGPGTAMPALQLVDSNGAAVPVVWVTASPGMTAAGQPASGQLCVVLPSDVMPAHMVANMPQPVDQPQVPLLMIPSRQSPEQATADTPTLLQPHWVGGPWQQVTATAPEQVNLVTAAAAGVHAAVEISQAHSASADPLGKNHDHASLTAPLHRRSRMSLPATSTTAPTQVQSVMLPSGGLEDTAQLDSAALQYPRGLASPQAKLPNDDAIPARPAASLSVSTSAVNRQLPVPVNLQAPGQTRVKPLSGDSIHAAWRVHAPSSDPNEAHTAEQHGIHTPAASQTKG